MGEEGGKTTEENRIEKASKGGFYLLRCRNAGVIFGEVVEAGIGYAIMKNARRVWRPISKDKSLAWYEGVALSGLCEDEGKISGFVAEKIIVEDYELTLCSEVARVSLEGFKSNETYL